MATDNLVCCGLNLNMKVLAKSFLYTDVKHNLAETKVLSQSHQLSLRPFMNTSHVTLITSGLRLSLD